jgi:SPP1 gp7 family putative phage head morphogenesis protein
MGQIFPIRPKKSISGAVGFYHINDSTYYDALAEMVLLCPPLRRTIDLVITTIGQRQISFRLDGEETPESKAALDLAWQLEDHVPALIDMLAQGFLINGKGDVEIVWGYDAEGRMVPTRFSPVHPGLIVYDDNRNPCYYSDGDGFKAGDRLPDYKFIHVTRPALEPNPFGRSAVQEVATPWFAYREVYTQLLHAISKYGLPLLVASMRPGVGEETRDQQQQMALVQSALQSIVSRGAVGLVKPDYVDSLEALDTKLSSATIPHFQALDRAEGEIIRHFLGGTLAVDAGDSGGRALGEVQERIGEKINRAITRHIEIAIQKYLVEPLLKLNWTGPESTLPKVYLDLDTKDEADLELLKAKYETARVWNLPVRESQMRADWNLEAKVDESDVMILPPPPTQPQGPGAQPTVPFVSPVSAPATAGTGEALAQEFDEDAEAEAVGIRAGIERKARERMLAVSHEIAKDTERATVEATGKALANAKSADDIEVETELPASVAAGIMAAKLLAAGSTWQQIGSQISDSERFAEDDIAEAFRDFHDAVNMSASELRAWKENPASREASLNPGVVINRVLRLLETPRDKWTAKDATDARKVTAFVGRMSKMEQGEPVNKDVPYSKRDISLKNWGFDPRKKSMAERRVTFAEVSDFPPDFRPAVEYMRQRIAVAPEELDAILEAVNGMKQFGLRIDDLIVNVRDQFVTFKRLTDQAAVESVKQWTIEGVGQGKTFRQMIEEGQRLVSEGKLPDLSRARIENIARTETAKAYSAQRQQLDSSPIVQRNLAGYVYMNPDDSRSRPSHAALNGKFFPAGSPELERLGEDFPKSYQCRCTMAPRLRIPGRPDPEKDPNLMQLVENLERF